MSNCGFSKHKILWFPGDVCLLNCPAVPHPWPLLQQHRWPGGGLHLEEAGQCGQGDNLLFNQPEKEKISYGEDDPPTMSLLFLIDISQESTIYSTKSHHHNKLKQSHFIV